VRFGQVFAFAFSPRPRTPAAKYETQIPENEKKIRLKRIFEISDRISRELNQALVGQTLPVLIDGESRLDREHWQGRGDDNRVVNFSKTGNEAQGDIVEVRIRRAGPHSLSGEAVQNQNRLPVFTGTSGTGA
jgi:tRNA-2-methylthio-N6-dimethylallyladenosine synthase